QEIALIAVDELEAEQLVDEIGIAAALGPERRAMSVGIVLHGDLSEARKVRTGPKSALPRKPRGAIADRVVTRERAPACQDHRPRRTTPHNTNAIRIGGEFGIFEGGQRMAGRLIRITDVHALGARAGAYHQLLSGHGREDARLVGTLLREAPQDADDVAS